MSLAEKVFGAVETVEGVAQRLNAKIMGSVQPMAEKAAVSAQNERRAKELRETLAQQQKRLQALQEPFKGLSKDQVAGLIRQAVKLRQENEQEKQERAQQIKSDSRPSGNGSAATAAGAVNPFQPTLTNLEQP